ncbi:hypothetical protein [Streptomyces sp. NPDC090025]|uniref:hypothetical protein n=1 Tax=Streptomyces sp. NPDC090025 TaxID=3365922 RepID=UPI003833EAC0
MKLLFMVALVIATVAEIVVVAALIFQGFRHRDGSEPSRKVLRGDDVLASAGLFGGLMTATALIAHGWDAYDSMNVLLFAATFGIVTAALLERFRDKPAARAAYLLPAGFGIVAGLAGSGL